jgi:hypothetical protein
MCMWCTWLLQVVGAVGYSKQRLELPPDLAPEVSSLIHLCWQDPPGVRPDFEVRNPVCLAFPAQVWAQLRDAKELPQSKNNCDSHFTNLLGHSSGSFLPRLSKLSRHGLSNDSWASMHTCQHSVQHCINRILVSYTVSVRELVLFCRRSSGG